MTANNVERFKFNSVSCSMRTIYYENNKKDMIEDSIIGLWCLSNGINRDNACFYKNFKTGDLIND